MEKRISISTKDGSFDAYLASPGASQSLAPAVVVIQEIFGVNQDMRDTCDELATMGYLAVCPDLFWRMERGIDMSAFSDADWQKGVSLYQAFDYDRGVADLEATIDVAQHLPGASGKVGIMGFCLGGLMTFLVSTRRPVDAAVAYYGGGTDRHIGKAEGLKGPLLMHLAEEDEFIDKQAQATIKAALQTHPSVQVHSYPGCRHAFARHRGAHFDAPASELAHTRTAAFFRSHLWRTATSVPA